MADVLELLPGVDLVTDRAVVLMQDRPVVGLSAWLLDALIAAGRADRELQLVTPRSTRLTYPARSRLFTEGAARWVVHHADGAYDALEGTRLEWDGERFAPADEPAQISRAWATGEPGIRANLQLVARVRYQPLESTIVGRATEILFSGLSGAVPAGWGTEEPVSQPWNTGQLTAFCRGRGAPTMLTVVGQPGPDVPAAAGVLEIENRPAGLEETLTLAVAQEGIEAPEPDALVPVVDRLADEFELVSLFVMAAGAAPDTCALPYLTGVPGPVGLALGPEVTRALGADAAVAGGAARRIGPASASGVWFGVGSGFVEPDWQAFSRLVRQIARASGTRDPAASWTKGQR